MVVTTVLLCNLEGLEEIICELLAESLVELSMTYKAGAVPEVGRISGIL